MTRVAKITVLTSALLGFATGSLLGLHTGKLGAEGVQAAQIMAPAETSADFAARQFKNADPSHARQAVLLEIGILRRLERVAGDSAQERILGFAYTRLAIIEEDAGLHDAALAAFNEAREWFKRSNPNGEMTNEQLRDSVERMDKALDRN